MVEISIPADMVEWDIDLNATVIDISAFDREEWKASMEEEEHKNL